MCVCFAGGQLNLCQSIEQTTQRVWTYKRAIKSCVAFENQTTNQDENQRWKPECQQLAV